MAKNLKLNIKNAQIAEAVNLSSLKGKLAKKKAEGKSTPPLKEESKDKLEREKLEKEKLGEKPGEKKEEAPKKKARSRSAFADGNIPHAAPIPSEETPLIEKHEEESEEFFEEKTASQETIEKEPSFEEAEKKENLSPEALRAKLFKDVEVEQEVPEPLPKPKETPPAPQKPLYSPLSMGRPRTEPPRFETPKERLGPTGKHIKDLTPPPREFQRPPPRDPRQAPSGEFRREGGYPPRQGQGFRPREGFRPGERPGGDRPPSDRPGYGRPPFSRPEGRGGYPGTYPSQRTAPPAPPSPDKGPVKSRVEEGSEEKKAQKAQPAKFREFRDLKPAKRLDATRQFNARDKQGLNAGEDDAWRGKKRKSQGMRMHLEEVIRPTSLKVRLPISIKDLAEKMKLKASQLIGKLFLQGMVLTLNDMLEDETVIQLLGQDFGCEIAIDTSREERIRITDKTAREEILSSEPSLLKLRPPVVAFMGHVDHGKTSLIDAIRSSNRVSGEAGAITQHIGAFRCKTPVGDITILDTPGHEAFSAMRARGADVTDIVVLVVAGDEGIRQQTVEAIQHAKAANVTIVVAINKSDKPNFNQENVYRQLSEHELLPEAWGGQTITINCSAVTREGIKELLEMLALQAEVLELKANPEERARGAVIESEMHKGLGAVATVLVQNGTLRLGDALVFSHHFGRVKTMLDEHGSLLKEAGPATPVSITGLSSLPEAGEDFIVVKSEKEAREISEARALDARQSNLLLKKKVSMDHLMQQASETGKKILNIVLRADVQGSLEALKVALLKIESAKAEVNIIFTGVGEISESDVQLASASKAVIIGFHTQVEAHAETLIKELGIEVRLHDIIYHAVDDVKLLMAGLLDKIPQENERGKALVKALFKSSQHGVIAGCQVTDGVIARNHLVRLIRGKDVVWKGTIHSLKRIKEDVKEVQKGLECGILLNNYNDAKEGDIIEAYDITYLTQEL